MFVRILACFHQFFMILSLQTNGSRDYASICAVSDICYNFRKHVMCEDGPVTCGMGNLYNSAVTLESSALHSFNSFRDSFGVKRKIPEGFPIASDMNEIVWCDQLRAFATKSVSMCRYGSSVGDDCRDTKTAPVGQLSYSKITGTNDLQPGFIEVFATWTSDLSSVNSSIGNYSAAKDSLSSLIVYSRLERMGCAELAYKLNSTHNVKIVVCNLSPAGPELGKPIYQPGPRCSKCHGKRSCSNFKESVNYPNLCRGPADETPIEKSSADYDLRSIFVLARTAISLILIGFIQ